MTQQGDQPVLFTMRIKTARWESIKRAHDIVFGEAVYVNHDSGLLYSRIYRNDADSNEVMLVSEWQSHEDLRRFALEHGERFNEMAGTRSDEGEDVVWRLEDEMRVES